MAEVVRYYDAEGEEVAPEDAETFEVTDEETGESTVGIMRQ
jgi:hypothetical protein